MSYLLGIDNRPADQEEAAFGAALLSGVAAGLYPNREEALQQIRYEH